MYCSVSFFLESEYKSFLTFKNNIMNIISWNINGVRAIIKNNFYEWVLKQNPDILCLQEIKATNEQTTQLLQAFKNFNIFSNSADKKGYSGTALLSRIKPILVTRSYEFMKIDKEGRVICAEFSNFFLINVYVPNSGLKLKRLDYRKKWDSVFLNYITRLRRKKPVLICGDLNVAHRAIDLKNDKANFNKIAGYTQVEIDGMNNILNNGFVDSFRHLYPDKIAYTYWSYRFNARAKNSGWRIDYILVDVVLKKSIKEASIFSDVFGSDHCPIGVQLDLM